MDYFIREIYPNEYEKLDDFLYEAIFQRDENNLLPRNIIKKPELQVFIKDFGKSDDNCLVAEHNGKIIGAVWTRILDGQIRGYGNIDSETPEFAISIYKEYRNKGIGTALMNNMLNFLYDKGYKKGSLAVQKDNYAYKMYINVGFKIIDETEEEYIMIYEFSPEHR